LKMVVVVHFIFFLEIKINLS